MGTDLTLPFADRDLIRPVDRDVDPGRIRTHRLVEEVEQGNPALCREFPAREGGRHASDIEAGVDPIAEPPDRVGRRRPGAESDHLAVSDRLGRRLAGASLRRIAPAAFFHEVECVRSR